MLLPVVNGTRKCSYFPKLLNTGFPNSLNVSHWCANQRPRDKHPSCLHEQLDWSLVTVGQVLSPWQFTKVLTRLSADGTFGQPQDGFCCQWNDEAVGALRENWWHHGAGDGAHRGMMASRWVMRVHRQRRLGTSEQPAPQCRRYR